MLFYIVFWLLKVDLVGLASETFSINKIFQVGGHFGVVRFGKCSEKVSNVCKAEAILKKRYSEWKRISANLVNNALQTG